MSTLNYDPDVPVYAAPDTTAPVSALNTSQVQSPLATVDQTTTAQGQVTGMLNDPNNKLMQAAQSTAARTMNKRGLLNSSITAGEGVKAMIEAATPIAQTDAALYGDLYKQNNQSLNSAALNNQVADLEYQKSLSNAAITGALTSQEYGGKIAIQRMSDAAQLQRVEVDNAFNLQINNDNLDASERTSLIQSSTALGQELTGSLERILRDTNIDGTTKDAAGKTPKDYAIDAIMTNYRAQLNTSAALVGLNLTWN